MHARHLGSEISDCGVRVGPGYRETIPNQGVGSLAHECNEGVALVHGQGARVACSVGRAANQAPIARCK